MLCVDWLVCVCGWGGGSAVGVSIYTITYTTDFFEEAVEHTE